MTDMIRLPKPAVLLLVPALAGLLSGCGMLGFGPQRGYAVAGRAAAPAGRDAYAGMIARHAAQNGVPVALASAMVQIESGFNPNVTGRAGEIGLMQIKYETARSLGYGGSRSGLYDPDTNLAYGMIYLAQAQAAGGGPVCSTVLKYQGGLRASRHSDWTRQSCARAQQLMAQG